MARKKVHLAIDWRTNMPSPHILKSLISLASGLSLLMLAGNHTLPLAEPQFDVRALCLSTPGTLFQFLMWATSDLGRAMLSLGMGASAVISYLCNHRLKEARELGIAMATLFLFLIIAVVTAKVETPDLTCHRPAQSMHSSALKLAPAEGTSAGLE